MSETLYSHEEILGCLHEAGRDLGASFIAPACLGLMPMRFTAYCPGRFLCCEMTPPDLFANPMGLVQGGLVMGAFDNVFGPFSILESGLAAVTLELNGTFIRPLSVSEGPFEVRAGLVEKTRSFLVMEGEARTARGTLAARAHTRMFFVRGKP